MNVAELVRSAMAQIGQDLVSLDRKALVAGASDDRHREHCSRWPQPPAYRS